VTVVAGKNVSGLLKMNIGVIEKQKEKTVVYPQNKNQFQKEKNQYGQQRPEKGDGGWLARGSVHGHIVKECPPMSIVYRINGRKIDLFSAARIFILIFISNRQQRTRPKPNMNNPIAALRLLSDIAPGYDTHGIPL
jgi:hypothetical protein